MWATRVFAVLLVLVLNLIEAATYGRIFFPASTGIAPELGFTLFLWATGWSQVVYSAWSSLDMPLACSGIVESIPFVHQMARASTSYSDLVAGSALSALLAAALFWGMARSGQSHVLRSFPQPVLLGILLGISGFLLQTAHAVVRGHAAVFLALLAVSVLTVLLVRSPFALLAAAVALTALFWALHAALRFGLDDWTLPSVEPQSPWTLYGGLRWPAGAAVLRMLPAVLGNAAFAAFHFSINLSSLVQTAPRRNVRVSFRDELTAHAAINGVAVLAGWMPCYLEFCNSILFARASANAARGVDNVALGVLTLAACFADLRWLLDCVPLPVVAFVTLFLAVQIALVQVAQVLRRYASAPELAVALAVAATCLGVGYGEAALLGFALQAAHTLHLHYHQRFRSLSFWNGPSVMDDLRRNAAGAAAGDGLEWCFRVEPDLTVLLPLLELLEAHADRRIAVRCPPHGRLARHLRGRPNVRLIAQ